MPRPVPSLERQRLRTYLLLICADIAVIAGGLLMAGAAYLGEWPSEQALRQATLLVPLYLTIALYQGTYSMRALVDPRFATTRGWIALGIAAGLLAFIAFFLKTSATFSRGTLAIGLVLTAVMIFGVRTIAARLVEKSWRGFVSNRLLVLDDGPTLDIPTNRIIVAADFGLDPTATDPHDLHRLGQVLLNQDEVIVSCPPDRREKWAWVLKANGVHGEVISDVAHSLGAIGIRRYEEADCSAMVVSAGPLPLSARVMKRLFDIGFASLALLFVLPVMMLIALAIWLEDRGPVLFVQQRTGRHNRFFLMYKFRSMMSDRLDADGQQSTARDDERVTRVGRFIRRTSLDELPQLFNVLRGEMSVVGPRPHAAGSRAGAKKFWQVDERYWHRHALKPGLTGLAQIRGFRGATEEESDLSDRLQADLEYLSNWSLTTDTSILLRTVRVIIHDRAF